MCVWADIKCKISRTTKKKTNEQNGTLKFTNANKILSKVSSNKYVIWPGKETATGDRQRWKRKTDRRMQMRERDGQTASERESTS